MHGAGSPQAQRIMIQRQGNIGMKKKLAKAIAKIDDYLFIIDGVLIHF